MELALSAHKSRSVKDSICYDGIGYEQIWKKMKKLEFDEDNYWSLC